MPAGMRCCLRKAPSCVSVHTTAVKNSVPLPIAFTSSTSSASYQSFSTLPTLTRPPALSSPLKSRSAAPESVGSATLVSSLRSSSSEFKSNFTSQATMTSLRHIPAKNLHVSTPTWWLESRFHFSFADYYNPANTNFGVLRVLNDDLVQPHSGFGTHGHRDMEIFTYVVDGKLTHKDSMGTAETLGRGAAQYMSAGRGITHSEMNEGSDLLRFLQIWIKPDNKGYAPNYGSRTFTKEDRHNKLQHLLTSFRRYPHETDTGTGVIPIHQDANIYVSEADPGLQQNFKLSAGRQVYMVCIEGGLKVNDKTLAVKDALEAVAVKGGGPVDLTLVADPTEGAHFLMIEMAQE
eukprot:TRINITY_DN4868_c0_g1_i4.p1 TRINITY_DN4868_c0_g1~~TRINITY_DN4868_c0_g1_i4.p1  ORF type:complete len:348 (+),score=43.73 TRINITY_DN4868_c0_g1_i4:141-1184(+)